ncbi:sarcosine oxidase subunit gamma [Actinomycetospora sp. TBRC 11914]|uniref:sarcosine oxidase subunit gamma n=1 Tax=Actinomycetospora sp. TBRC 11914 TaxID=2729387 RepID=UPI00145E9D4A|nr:sarcosine oxidase subunit gamma family protein [Actinomycetospora sp. TBRC 11914]NMO88517.1 sarcosine oxidase subunit gamma [Actinomycetospora sp. TBRC 11914]
MADTLVPTHPLERYLPVLAALTEELAAVPGVDLALGLLPTTAAVDLRLDAREATTPDVVGTLGGRLPSTPNTWTTLDDGEGRALWLGPDEWLLVADRPAGPWEDALRAVVGPRGGAAVDVSAQRTGFTLRGADARELLALGCALDLRPASFPPGSCAQTLLGQAGVLLVAVDTGVDVLVRRSFADYLAAWLLDAAEEFRPIPAGEGDRA